MASAAVEAPPQDTETEWVVVDGVSRPKNFKERYVEERAKRGATPDVAAVLTKGWEDMSAPHRARVRSRRAATGVKCSKCGNVGFYAENCPRCKADAFATEEPSYDSIHDGRSRGSTYVKPPTIVGDHEFDTWAGNIMKRADHLNHTGTIDLTDLEIYLDSTTHEDFLHWLQAHGMKRLNKEGEGALKRQELVDALKEYHKLLLCRT